jgi:hypothetical protein
MIMSPDDDDRLTWWTTSRKGTLMFHPGLHNGHVRDSPDLKRHIARQEAIQETEHAMAHFRLHSRTLRGVSQRGVLSGH